MTTLPSPFWVVEAADGPCSTCGGSGGHPTLDTSCPRCYGSRMDFNPILGPTAHPIRHSTQRDALQAGLSWFAGRPVIYRVVHLDPCPDHTGRECLHCHGAGHVRHRPTEAPIFGGLVLPDECGIP